MMKIDFIFSGALFAISRKKKTSKGGKYNV